MEKIPSFTINHEKLLRGIYVSRKDSVGNDTVTTFDIRMKEPNREPALHPGALHTIEHLAANRRLQALLAAFSPKQPYISLVASASHWRSASSSSSGKSLV